VIKIAMPGKTQSPGLISMIIRPAFKSQPQLGVGGFLGRRFALSFRLGSCCCSCRFRLVLNGFCFRLSRLRVFAGMSSPGRQAVGFVEYHTLSGRIGRRGRVFSDGGWTTA
jgi:hypothetical protein